MSGDREQGAAVDIAGLYEKVKAQAAERLRSGFYTEREIEDVRSMELVLKEQRGFGMNLDEGVAWLNANWDPLTPVPITSHRPLLGRILVPAKRALRKVIRPFASLALAKQAEFNGKVTHLLTAAIHQIEGMEAWIRRIEVRMDLAENRVTLLEGRFEEILLKYFEVVRQQQEQHRRHADLSAEVDRVRALAQAARRPLPAPSPAPAGTARAAGEAPATEFPYLAFEERHRGSSTELKERQRAYLEHFRGARNVLDAGCGRGEFLELLGEAGIGAYGVDLDPEMVARCREKGLRAEQGDVLSHLRALPDGSLGGVFAAQVVEHLTTPELLRFIALAHAKIAPGGRLVAETINPACLATFAGAFYLDLTHTRPIHPEALRFAVEAAGFAPVEVVMRSPFPAEARLKEVDLFHRIQKFEDALLNVVNDNFNQLNELIYGNQDYAVVGTRGE